MSISAFSVTIKVTKPIVRRRVMLNTNYIENLLGIKDINLINVEKIDDSTIIEFKMNQRIHKCPRCGSETSKVHDYRIQDVKDISCMGTHTILRIHKRRHVCKSCGKRFYEHVSLVHKYQRTINRL